MSKTFLCFPSSYFTKFTTSTFVLECLAINSLGWDPLHSVVTPNQVALGALVRLHSSRHISEIYPLPPRTLAMCLHNFSILCHWNDDIVFLAVVLLASFPFVDGIVLIVAF